MTRGDGWDSFMGGGRDRALEGGGGSAGISTSKVNITYRGRLDILSIYFPGIFLFAIFSAFAVLPKTFIKYQRFYKIF